MIEESKLSSLIYLLDDPDEEVYGQVKLNLVSYGEAIIPRLENTWEFSNDNTVQSRIEDILHCIHFVRFKEAFDVWAAKKNHSLIDGVAILSTYLFPQLDLRNFTTDLQVLKREIWLELSHLYSPHKSITKLNQVFFHQRQLILTEPNNKEGKYFFVNQLLNSKKGEPIAMVLLYALQASMLNIPVYPIAFPDNMILLAFSQESFHPEKPINHYGNSIEFFINPCQHGMIINQAGLENFLRQQQYDADVFTYPLLCNAGLIKFYIEILIKFYNNQNQFYRVNELQELVDILHKYHPKL